LRDWVWTIHKEADTILHTRIQSFMTLQPFLFAAYFSVVALVKDQTLQPKLAIFLSAASTTILSSSSSGLLFLPLADTR